MNNPFEQIEKVTADHLAEYFRNDPVETLRLESAPHPNTAEGKQLAERIFQHYRSVGFPYVNFDDDRLRRDFELLQNQGFPIENKQLRSNMVGLRIVNMFHPAMESVTCRNYRTAKEVFENDDLLKGAIRKMLLYSKEQGRTVGNRLRIHLLSYSGVQGVSNFRPGSAKQVYDHFQPHRILDFSMGWGGRLLAAMAGGYPYIGIDPNGTTCQGNLEIKRKMEALFPGVRFPIKLIQGCAEDILGRGYFPQIDLVFTSPPYLNAEQYENSPYQSFKRYPTEEAWYKRFLQPCIVGAFADLVPGGHLVINVNPDMEERTLEYAKAAGFAHLDTWQYLLSLRQQNKRHKTTQVRGEPVLVFQRPVSVFQPA